MRAVDERLLLEPLDRAQLVLHLERAEAAVDRLFEGDAAVRRAAVVEAADHVALGGERLQPQRRAAEPLVGDELHVGAAVDVEQHRALLAFGEVRRQRQVAVEHGVVFGLDLEQALRRQREVRQRVVRVAAAAPGRCCRSSRRAVGRVSRLDQTTAAHLPSGDSSAWCVPRSRVSWRTLAAVEVGREQVQLARILTGGLEEDGLAVGADGEQALHVEGALGDLLHHLAVGFVQPQVAMALLRGPPEEAAVGQERRARARARSTRRRVR
jgi:hypothetical protein